MAPLTQPRGEADEGVVEEAGLDDVVLVAPIRLMDKSGQNRISTEIGKSYLDF